MEKYFTIPQLAQKMGITRGAVYKKVKAGKIPAMRVGKNYLISLKDVEEIVEENLSEEKKREIEKAVKKTVEEYGEVLKKLGEE
ncbi:MAG: helix-turn-helix domain-containing protein [Candidatus Omnitrophota bacterium]